MNDNFSGQEYDFAAGSIKGLRGWDMDPLGRLHGVTHKEVWLPGENVAVCKQTREIPCPNPVAPKDHLPKLSEAAVESKPKRKRRRGHISPYSIDPAHEPLADWERDLLYGTRPRCGEATCYQGKHTVGSGHSFDPSCSCGFWAYDEGGFAFHGSVIGVIEGYGKTTVGTKGFRCEKARIVAFCENDADGKRHSRSVLARLASLYPEVAFYEDLGSLIDAHGGVLRNWPEVGDDFWLRPVRSERIDTMRSWGSMSLTLGSSMQSFTQRYRAI